MIDYAIDASKRLIKVQMSGASSCADFERYCARLYNDPQYDVTFDHLFYVDLETDGDILGELPKLKTVLELVAQSETAAKKWAVVMPSLFKRLVVEFVLKNLRLDPIQIRFFASEDDALAWLSQPRDGQADERGVVGATKSDSRC